MVKFEGNYSVKFHPNSTTAEKIAWLERVADELGLQLHDTYRSVPDMRERLERYPNARIQDDSWG